VTGEGIEKLKFAMADKVEQVKEEARLGLNPASESSPS
jgi:hypothetical protein